MHFRVTNLAKMREVRKGKRAPVEYSARRETNERPTFVYEQTASLAQTKRALFPCKDRRDVFVSCLSQPDDRMRVVREGIDI
jgi:hypothetical protein